VAWRTIPPTDSIATLQRLCDQFVEEYNSTRPHSSLRPERPPAVAYLARPKAGPGDRSGDVHLRVRRDRADDRGKVTLRIDGRLYAIALGSDRARTRVLMLVDDLHVRVVDASTGELIRELEIDLSKKFQGTGRPPGPRAR
jgi:Integrase core domain